MQETLHNPHSLSAGNVSGDREQDPLDSQHLNHLLRVALLEIDSTTGTTRLATLIETWISKACSGSYPHLRQLLLRLSDEPGDRPEKPVNGLIQATRAALNAISVPPTQKPDGAPTSTDLRPQPDPSTHQQPTQADPEPKPKPEPVAEPETRLNPVTTPIKSLTNSKPATRKPRKSLATVPEPPRSETGLNSIQSPLAVASTACNGVTSASGPCSTGLSSSPPGRDTRSAISTSVASKISPSGIVT